MLKKINFGLLITILGVVLMGLPVLAQGTDYDYVKTVDLVIGDKDATVNGAVYAMDQAAYVKDGRTLVPFRFLAEALGATVIWDDKTSTASLNLQGSEVKVTVGSKYANINGAATTLDVPAEITGGRTFVPLRFVSEALGAQVDYNAETKNVRVVFVDTSDWKEFNDEDGIISRYPTDWSVTGNATVGLDVYSPSGSKLSVIYVQNDPAEVLEAEKTEYTEKGFEVIEEGPVDPNDSTQGLSLNLVKANETDQSSLETVTILASKDEKGTLVVTIYTTVENSVDLIVIDKLLK